MKGFKILIFILLSILVFCFLFKGALWVEEYLEEKVSYSKSEIPKDYIKILNIDSSNIGYSKTIYEDNAAIISSFEYKGKINVIALKLDMLSQLPLYSIVDRFNDLTSLGIGGGVTYSNMDNSLLNFYYVPDYAVTKIKSVHIHLAKSNLSKELIANDSICAYFIRDSYGFKIKFNENQNHDISVEMKPPNVFEKSNQPLASVNMLLLLRKRHEFLYLYLIHRSNNEVREIEEDELTKLYQ